MKFFRLFIILLAFGVGNAWEHKLHSNKGHEVVLKGKKNLVVGHNDFHIEFYKDGKKIDAEIDEITFMMPEMPGMPAMDKHPVLKSDHIDIDLPMAGTWQVRVEFKEGGSKYLARGSISL